MRLRINDVIKKLKELKKEYGNVEVVMDNWCCPNYHPIQSVYFKTKYKVVMMDSDASKKKEAGGSL